MVFLFANLNSEIFTLVFLPGVMLNWFVEQLIIEIINEPYFNLGNYSSILNFFFYFSVLFLIAKTLLTISITSRKNRLEELK